MFNISSSVLASTVLLWEIDSIQRRESDKETNKIKAIINKSLNKSLNKYYDFYLKLYIATRETKVQVGEAVLHSLLIRLIWLKTIIQRVWSQV